MIRESLRLQLLKTTEAADCLRPTKKSTWSLLKTCPVLVARTNNPGSLRRRKVRGSRSATLKSGPRNLSWEVGPLDVLQAPVKEWLWIDWRERMLRSVKEDWLLPTMKEDIICQLEICLKWFCPIRKPPLESLYWKLKVSMHVVCRILSSASVFHRSVVLQQLDTSLPQQWVLDKH